MKLNLSKVQFWTFITICVYLVGLTGLLWDRTHDLFLLLTPLNILFAYFVVFLFHKKFDFTFFMLAAFIFLLGMTAEIIGVKTGLVFGEYEYGDTLGLQILNVPVLIGLNWFFLVYCVYHFSKQFFKKDMMVILFSVICLIIYDMVLESPAIAMNMWSWDGKSYPPIHNFIAWGVLGLIMTSVFTKKINIQKNNMAINMFQIQFIFFLLLTIFL
ncbi:MAG: carotenoid biosynthesis protein [Chitinophagaceae bacterium]|nr:MAG: carotenoid biosynthesis protein [Chitinophagaceae bacterium]